MSCYYKDASDPGPCHCANGRMSLSEYAGSTTSVGTVLHRPNEPSTERSVRSLDGGFSGRFNVDPLAGEIESPTRRRARLRSPATLSFALAASPRVSPEPGCPGRC